MTTFSLTGFAADEDITYVKSATLEILTEDQAARFTYSVAQVIKDGPDLVDVTSSFRRVQLNDEAVTDPDQVFAFVSGLQWKDGASLKTSYVLLLGDVKTGGVVEISVFLLGGSPLPPITTVAQFEAFEAQTEGVVDTLPAPFGPGDALPLTSIPNISVTEDDVLIGTDGQDVLEGGLGQDRLEGGDGWDVLNGGAEADVLLGGNGRDTATYLDGTAGVRVALQNAALNTGDAAGDRLVSIENIIGSTEDDDLRGNQYANQLRGHNGADTLFGNGGRDQLFGGNGDDRLYGGNGNDLLQGGAGNDVLFGGAGADRLMGGAGNDTVNYFGAVNGVRVALGNSGINSNSAAGDQFFSIENITGTTQSDDLRGNQYANTLRGYSGADTLIGNFGADTLYGGQGADRLIGGRGQDQLFGGQGADAFVFTQLTDSQGATADVIGDFGIGNDVIDLSALDVDSGTDGNQVFAFIGTAAYTGTAGELRYVQGVSNTVLSGDIDGDMVDDFQIRLSGTLTLSGDDFIL